MKRTYNVFVDNGLFVLAYYLEKDIEDITEEDIENNIEVMCKKIVKFTKCEKYSNLKSMVFPNSPLTQKSGDLGEKVKGFLNFKGNDICVRCGEKKANIFNDINKTYVPNIVSLTMYNYANNLQGVNICPHCLALTVFSILNCRVAQDVILYNSTDDEFMYSYTEEIQDENNRDMYINARKEKSNGISKREALENLWKFKEHKVYSGFLEQISFNNIGVGMPTYEVITIDNKNIDILNKINVNGLEKEFFNPKYSLFRQMLNGTIQYRYLEKIIKWDNENSQIECSKELLEFLNMEVSRLKKSTIELLDRIADGIVELNKAQESYKKLKNLQEGISAFEDFLIDILSSYKELNGETLFNSNELIMLTNRMEYKRIKNLLIVKLIERF